MTNKIKHFKKLQNLSYATRGEAWAIEFEGVRMLCAKFIGENYIIILTPAARMLPNREAEVVANAEVKPSVVGVTTSNSVTYTRLGLFALEREFRRLRCSAAPITVIEAKRYEGTRTSDAASFEYPGQCGGHWLRIHKRRNSEGSANCLAEYDQRREGLRRRDTLLTICAINNKGL